MTRIQALFLVALLVVTITSMWWVSNHSSGRKRLTWFQKNLSKKLDKNQKLQFQNQVLRRQVMALRYDHRVIEREVRDVLSLARDGEIVVILPK